MSGVIPARLCREIRQRANQTRSFSESETLDDAWLFDFKTETFSPASMLSSGKTIYHSSHSLPSDITQIA
ncbi:hypothetical protein Rcae01_04724 [Novipirellula caenicola]|uniref:Uncharacterized protein n=1 Tax=Novipirellula caenicola TaxID=1536901 RepID=A0ABP9VY71_9BACT